MMKVQKRNGLKENVSFDKIQNKLGPNTKFSTNLSFLFHRNGVDLYVPIVFTPMVFLDFTF